VTKFPGHSPTPAGALIKLPVPFKTNQALPQKVRARQNFGSATGNLTNVIEVRDHTADFPAGLPRPELFPLPLNKCKLRIGVGNLIVSRVASVNVMLVTICAVITLSAQNRDSQVIIPLEAAGSTLPSAT
jgi:hypothetical protein